MPHARNRSVVHATARAALFEPDGRAPSWSVRWVSVSYACEPARSDAMRRSGTVWATSDGVTAKSSAAAIACLMSVVLLRILLKLRLAPLRAEVVRVTAVLDLRRGLIGWEDHPADGVLDLLLRGHIVEGAHSDLLRVDLGTLQRSGVVDIDRLPLAGDVDAGHTRFAVTIARLFHSAERQMHLGADGRRVDIKDACVHVAHGREGFVHVSRVNRR